MFKLVKCPESAKPELVECVDTPLGHLIYRCTRFRPACAMKCPRRCAAELDAARPSDGTQPPLDFDLDA